MRVIAAIEDPDAITAADHPRGRPLRQAVPTDHRTSSREPAVYARHGLTLLRTSTTRGARGPRPVELKALLRFEISLSPSTSASCDPKATHLPPRPSGTPRSAPKLCEAPSSAHSLDGLTTFVLPPHHALLDGHGYELDFGP